MSGRIAAPRVCAHLPSLSPGVRHALRTGLSGARSALWCPGRQSSRRPAVVLTSLKNRFLELFVCALGVCLFEVDHLLHIECLACRLPPTPLMLEVELKLGPLVTEPLPGRDHTVGLRWKLPSPVRKSHPPGASSLQVQLELPLLFTLGEAKCKCPFFMISRWPPLTVVYRQQNTHSTIPSVCLNLTLPRGQRPRPNSAESTCFNYSQGNWAVVPRAPPVPTVPAGHCSLPGATPSSGPGEERVGGTLPGHLGRKKTLWISWERQFASPREHRQGTDSVNCGSGV